MAISEETLSLIKKSNDIIEVISEYVKLDRMGYNSPIWAGLCPFHEEETKSFKVNTDTQSWFCYGCNKGNRADDNKGSDVIAFIQEIKDCGFKEAINILAERANIKIQETPKDPIEEQCKKEMTIHNKRYFNHLRSDNTLSLLAMDYLIKRGLTKETIDKFRLGLVPSNEISNRVDITNIANKIAIPIIETDKNPIYAKTLGMAYREPNDNPSNPKYKNDITSPCFSKGSLLYGLNFAIDSIRQKKYGIIVECYFGTIMLHQYGIENVVSSMGTMLTEEQILLAKKYSTNWILMYDGDKAGEDATLRALPLMLKLGINPMFVTLPEGDDADTFIMRIGKEKFEQWLDKNKKPLLDTVIDNILKEYDDTVVTAKVKALDKLDKITNNLSNNKNKVLQDVIAKRLNLG